MPFMKLWFKKEPKLKPPENCPGCNVYMSFNKKLGPRGSVLCGQAALLRENRDAAVPYDEAEACKGPNDYINRHKSASRKPSEPPG